MTTMKSNCWALCLRRSLFGLLLLGLCRLSVCASTSAAVATYPRPEEPQASGKSGSPGPGEFSSVDSPLSEDPIPVRRLRVHPEQLPAVLKQLDLGPVQRIPREELEHQLRAARRMVEETKRAPFLADLRVTAVLEGNDLIGRAECEIINPGTSPRLMVLEPWRMALSGASWSDGRPAVVGIPVGSSQIAVWVERSGSQTLQCDWSAAGMVTMDERRFELRWPVATTALLELDLAPDLVPMASGDTLVTGPFPTSTPRQKRWRIRFSGRSRLDLSIRPVTTSTPITVVESRCRFELQAMTLMCTYEFDLRPVRGNVNSWVFPVDPSLRILDVSSTPRSSWTVQPPSSQHGQLLLVTIPPTSSTVRLSIQAVAPLPAKGKLALPFIRPAESVLLREHLDVRIAPDWKVLHFAPGDYRIIQAFLSADQSHQLTLQGSWLPPGIHRSVRQSPTLVVGPAEACVGTTYEYLTWHLEGDSARLTAQIRLQVKKGPLFQFRCRSPEGYQLRRITAGKDAVLTHVDPKQHLITLEWLQPLSAGQVVDVHGEWVKPLPQGKEMAQPLPFPSISPLEVGERNGLLAIISTSIPGRAVPGPGTEPLGWLDWDFAPLPPHAQTALRYRGGDVLGYWLPTPTITARHPAPTPGPSPDTASILSQDSTSCLIQESFQMLLFQEQDSFLVITGAKVQTTASTATPCEQLITVPVTLDPSLHVEAISINGQWLSPTACHRDAEGRWLIPLPVSGNPIPVILRGRNSGQRYGVWWRITPPSVQWGNQQAPDLSYLYLPKQVLPLGHGERTSALPDTLDSLAEALPTGLDGSWWTLSTASTIWIGSSHLAIALGFLGMMLTLLIMYFLRGHSYVFWGLITMASAGLVVAVIVPSWWQQLIGLWCSSILLIRLIIYGWRCLPWSTSALLMGLLGVIVPGHPLAAQAQSGVTTTVLVLPPDAQGREEVVVPLSLWDRLARLRTPPPSWILTSAHYDVFLEGSGARVEARWVVHVLDRPDTPFLLPLGEARLESVRIHDALAYPIWVRSGVYALDLPGKGRHEISARFVLAISGTSERELRFGGLECPQTTLTVHSERVLRQLYLPGRAGRWSMDNRSDVRRVQAELGSVRPIVLRWREEGVGTARLRLREAHLWDLHPQGADLTAVYALEILGGSLTQVDLHIPESLEVLQLVVRSSEGSQESILRNWSVEAPRQGWRPLRIDFRFPTTGRWLIVLQATLRSPMQRSALLRFPYIIQPTASETETFYVLRLRDVRLESLHRQGVIDFSPDSLFPFFSSIPELRLDTTQTLRVFRPVDVADAGLQPTLRLAAELSVQSQTIWEVGQISESPSPDPRHGSSSLLAWANGTIRWKDSPTPGYFSMAVPGVQVHEIRGPDVAYWSHHEGMLHIWLKRPLTEGAVQWFGSFHPPVGVPFDLPLPRSVESALWNEQWQIRREEHLMLTWDRLRGWTMKDPIDTTSPWYTTFGNRQLPPPPRLTLQGIAPPSRTSQQQMP